MTVDEILRRAADDLVTDVRATTDPETALDGVVARRSSRRPPWLPLAAAVLVVVLVAGAAVALTRDEGEDVVAVPPSTTTAPRPTTPGPPTGESEGLDMTAVPSAGLAEGDSVFLTAEGLPPELTSGFVLCRSDALVTGKGMEACQLGPERDLVVDDAGHVESVITVERLLTVGPESTTVDCAREVRCAVGVVVRIPEEAEPEMEAFRYELRGLVAIELEPQEALAAPTLRVTPSEGLRHGDVVTIAGAGFAGPVGSGSLCVRGATPGGGECAYVALTSADQGFGNPEVDAAGRFEVEVPVWRAFPVHEGDGTVRTVDCAAVECVLEVVGDDGRAAPAIPLSFDSGPPLPVAPTISVTPGVGLRPGDPVTVTVDGLAEGQEAALAACALDAAAPGGCGSATSLDTVVGDADGQVTVTIPAIDPAQLGVDCTVAGRCAVALSNRLMPGEGDPMVEATVPVPVQYAP